MAAGVLDRGIRVNAQKTFYSEDGKFPVAACKFVAGPLNIVVDLLSSLFLSLKIQTQIQTQAQNLLASPQAMPTMKGGTM